MATREEIVALQADACARAVCWNSNIEQWKEAAQYVISWDEYSGLAFDIGVTALVTAATLGTAALLAPKMAISVAHWGTRLGIITANVPQGAGMVMGGTQALALTVRVEAALTILIGIGVGTTTWALDSESTVEDAFLEILLAALDKYGGKIVKRALGFKDKVDKILTLVDTLNVSVAAEFENAGNLAPNSVDIMKAAQKTKQATVEAVYNYAYDISFSYQQWLDKNYITIRENAIKNAPKYQLSWRSRWFSNNQQHLDKYLENAAAANVLRHYWLRANYLFKNLLIWADNEAKSIRDANIDPAKVRTLLDAKAKPVLNEKKSATNNTCKEHKDNVLENQRMHDCEKLRVDKHALNPHHKK